MKYDRLVLFDGYCGLCNKSVNILLHLDRKHRLRFAPLQGVTAAKNFKQEELKRYDSIAYAKRGKLYFRSAAAIRILADLGSSWKLVLILLIIPAFLRNAAYDFIAKRRFKYFGKLETCRLASEAEKTYFLD